MRELFSIRLLAILALVAGTLYVNTNFIAHHSVDFEKKENAPQAFNVLFAHLMPEWLIKPGSGHAAEGHGEASHGEESHGGGHSVDGHSVDGHSVDGHSEDGHAEDGHGADDHAAAASTDAGHAQADPLFALPLPGFLSVFDMTGDKAHPKIVFTNLQLFQVAAILLIFLCFSGVPRYLRTGKGDLITRFFAGFAHWLRDDVVFPVMGKELGSKWLPFFLTIFFFILFMNLMGLIPHGGTATASIFVTGGLAAITLTCMLVFGMLEQGPVAFWKNLVPHVPAPLWPIMFLVELMGVVVKPVALMLRLFATMMGGHMVVLTFMGLIFFIGLSMAPAAGFAVSPIAVGFAVFIMIIEAFVALLQAFIFTQLSVIFINASIHPDH